MSIHSKVIRIGESGSSNMFNDQKLTDMTKVIEGPLTTSSETDVVNNCVSDLETEYGASNVSQVTAPSKYIWQWDADTSDFVRICAQSSTITVDDGEPNNGKITVTIKEIVP